MYYDITDEANKSSQDCGPKKRIYMDDALALTSKLNKISNFLLNIHYSLDFRSNIPQNMEPSTI